MTSQDPYPVDEVDDWSEWDACKHYWVYKDPNVDRYSLKVICMYCSMDKERYLELYVKPGERK